MKIEVYVVDRVKYERGLTGVWITLPLQENILKTILDNSNIGIYKGEQLIIESEETLLSRALNINGYSDIFTINENLLELAQLTKSEVDIVIGLMDNGHSLTEAIEDKDNVSSFELATGRLLNENEKVAYGFIESIGGFTNISDDVIEDYFEVEEYLNEFYINNQYEEERNITTELKREILESEKYYFNYEQYGEDLAINLIIVDNTAISIRF